MSYNVRLALENDLRYGKAFTGALNDEQHLLSVKSDAATAHARAPSTTTAAALQNAEAQLAGIQQRVAQFRGIFDQTAPAVPTAARGNPALVAANGYGVGTRSSRA